MGTPGTETLKEHILNFLTWILTNSEHYIFKNRLEKKSEEPEVRNLMRSQFKIKIAEEATKNCRR